MSKKYKYRERFTFDGKVYSVYGNTQREVIEKKANKLRDLEEGKVTASYGSFQHTNDCKYLYTRGQLSNPGGRRQDQCFFCRPEIFPVKRKSGSVFKRVATWVAT